MTTVKSYIKKLIIEPVNRPLVFLASVFFIALILLAQVRQLTFDTSVESFLDSTNPQHNTYITFKERFGLSEYIILLIEDDEPFSEKSLRSLQKLQDKIETEVPFVKKTESILNSRKVISTENGLEIKTLVPESLIPDDSNALLQLATSTPYYVDRIINRDASATSLIIQLQASVKNDKTGNFQHIVIDDVSKSMSEIKRIVSEVQPEFKNTISIAGAPVAAVELLKIIKHDTLFFMAMALLVIGFVLWLFFKRLSAVYLPLVVMCLSILITLSIMLIGNFPIQVTSAILPSFLVVVCIGDSVHVLHAFFSRYDAGMEKRQAIIEAIGQTFKPMLYTSLTTAIGLMSFTVSDIYPIKTFGWFGALGVWIALALTFICLPAFMILTPIRRIPRVSNLKPYESYIYSRLMPFVKKNRILIIVFSLIATIAAIYFSSQLALSHDSLKWFKPDNPVRVSTETVDKKLTGTLPLELIIDTGEPYGIYDPVLLTKIDNWLGTLDSDDSSNVRIRSAISILDILKEINQKLSSNNEYTLPETRELVAQEILLLEVDNADEIAAYCDKQFQRLRITLSTPWQDTVNYTNFLDEIHSSFNAEFEDSIKLETTGMVALGNQTVKEMLYSMINSYLIAGVLVSIVLMVLLGNIKLGFIMMLPNLMPIVFTLTAMYLVNIPLDIFTLLIGSIAIGLIVDDSVHLICGFQKHYEETGNAYKALERTLTTAGRALYITTIVLCCGFLIYTMASLTNMQNFGILTSLCISLALLADFVLAPAIILVLYKHK